MSRKCVSVVAAIIATVAPGTLRAQPSCSTESMVGLWAASAQGTVFSAMGAAKGVSVGLVSIERDGRISIRLFGNTGGTIGQVPPVGVLSGTVEVNADCTGSLSATAPSGNWTLTEDFVIEDNGNQVRTVAVGPLLNMPAVWQCWWKRLSHVPMPLTEAFAGCAAASVKGTYGGTVEGVVLAGAPAPHGMLLRTEVGQDQSIRGVFTAVKQGVVTRGTIEGQVTELRSDCTGWWTYGLTDSGGTLLGQMREYFVVLENGKSIWSIPVQGPFGLPIALGRYDRISPVVF